MRTLSRPMFNMGGPIKEGVMHGIREPYRGGGAALVGNPVYPQTGGREHHGEYWNKVGASAMPILKSWMKPWKKLKNYATVAKKAAPIVGKGVKDLRGIFTQTGKTPNLKGITGSTAGNVWRNLKDFSFPGSAKVVPWAKKALTYANPLRKPKTSIAGGLALSSDPAREAYKNIKPIGKWMAEAALPGWAERNFYHGKLRQRI